ncbi:DUF2937 family protein [Pseudooceanicola sp. C21-150M6]|uniref:DUF2937 family protein n=1 Tax=Pseudooceanicola sp. C21-150M6 TaxID=3434355 RepID=UPI003D7FEB96
MITRALTLAGGLAGAATFAQFPEFSQQYTQRLAGAVDELTRVAADFDASAHAADLTREAALDQMTGTPFLDRRRADMTATFTRLEALQADLAALRGAGPFLRAYEMRHLIDPQIAARAAQDFSPALPLTFEGLIFAALGLLAGLALVSLIRRLAALILYPFRPRAKAT